MNAGAYTHIVSLILFANTEQDTGKITEISMLY
jgi:hypothetical protein